jgi:hypothetical protein
MLEFSLFPTGDLVVDGQRDAFFELVVVIIRDSDYVPSDLKTKSDIEILGDVALRPVCNKSFRIVDAYRLNS